MSKKTLFTRTNYSKSAKLQQTRHSPLNKAVKKKPYSQLERIIYVEMRQKGEKIGHTWIGLDGALLGNEWNYARSAISNFEKVFIETREDIANPLIVA